MTFCHLESANLKFAHQTLRLEIRKLAEPHRPHPSHRERLSPGAPPRYRRRSRRLHRRRDPRSEHVRLDPPHNVAAACKTACGGGLKRFQHSGVEFDTRDEVQAERRCSGVYPNLSVHHNHRAWQNPPEIGEEFGDSTGEPLKHCWR
uniref:Uncharacterized protein n=1 Tax=Opuntia streptacantha TaxID=393608 RepID=A0A7C9DMP3_OPUST